MFRGFHKSMVGLVFVSALAHADTRYVSLSGNNTAPYTNWSMAATSIQPAIDAATNGDVILIADGTYTGNANRNLKWNATNTPPKHLIIRSQNGPTNCILDCNSTGRGFTLFQGQTSSDVIDGLTIRNGISTNDTNPDPVDFRGGGGILMVGVSPTIQNWSSIRNMGCHPPGREQIGLFAGLSSRSMSESLITMAEPNT